MSSVIGYDDFIKLIVALAPLCGYAERWHAAGVNRKKQAVFVLPGVNGGRGLPCVARAGE